MMLSVFLPLLLPLSLYLIERAIAREVRLTKAAIARGDCRSCGSHEPLGHDGLCVCCHADQMAF